MPVTEDITPEGVWERRAIALGIETMDGILGVKVVDGLEHLHLLPGAEVHLTSPRGFPTTCTPVPSIVQVMDIVIVVHLFRDNLGSVIIIVPVLSQI